jgi:hypothetical protein
MAKKDAVSDLHPDVSAVICTSETLRVTTPSSELLVVEPSPALQRHVVAVLEGEPGHRTLLNGDGWAWFRSFSGRR